jgi:arabinose operon protein AraL
MLNGFIFDLDGTVYLGERLIPGADRVIRLLREAGRKVVFLSNKPLYTREDYAAKLTRLGIPTEPSEVVNSTFVLIRYLEKVAPDAKVFVMGELPFNIAFQAIKKGAHFIATNPDRTCPVEGGELPDCAGVIAALEATTLKKVEVIVGKPSPITAQVALEVMGLEAAECILVGDRLETDIRMGLEAGMKTALVMTGVTDAKTLETSPVHPDHVFDSIADLEGLLWQAVEKRASSALP